MKITIKNLQIHLHYHEACKTDMQAFMQHRVDEEAARKAGEIPRSEAYAPLGVQGPVKATTDDGLSIRDRLVKLRAEILAQLDAQALKEEFEREPNPGFPPMFPEAPEQVDPTVPDKKRTATDLATDLPSSTYICHTTESGLRYVLGVMPPSEETEYNVSHEDCNQILVPLSEFFAPLLCTSATKLIQQVVGLDIRKNLARLSLVSAEGRQVKLLCGTLDLVAAVMGCHCRSLIKLRMDDPALETIKLRYISRIAEIKENAAKLRELHLELAPVETVEASMEQHSDLKITDLYNMHPTVPREFIKDYLVQRGILLRKALAWGSSGLREVARKGLKDEFAVVRPVNCEMIAKAGTPIGEGRKVRYQVFFTLKTAELLEKGPDLSVENKFIEAEYARFLAKALPIPGVADLAASQPAPSSNEVLPNWQHPPLESSNDADSEA